MTERITFLTPVGVSKYPYVQQADTAFGQNKYKTSLVLPKADAEPLVEKLKEVWTKENGKETLSKAKLPYKVMDDGSYIFNMASKIQPKVFDTAGNYITEDLGLRSGSKLQVKGTIATYNTGNNQGVSMYMNNVQVHEVVKMENSSPFENKGNGFVHKTENTADEAANQADF